MYFPIQNTAQKSVLACEVIFAIIPTIAVSLRIYTRRVKQIPFAAHDYYILVAWVLTMCYVGVAISSVVNCGVGLHMVDIIEQHGLAPITLFLKELIAIQLLWAITLTFVKVSILLFYSTLFAVRGFVLGAKLAAVFVIMWAAAVILSALFLCHPFAYNWNQTIPGGHCGNQTLSYIITGAINIVTDVVVLTLPLPYIWSLNLKLSTKIALVATFSVGFFICIVSILRLISLTSLSYTDITYDVPKAVIWSTLEPCLGVTLACLPIIRTYFSHDRSQVSNTHDQSFQSGSSRFSNKKFRPLDDDHHYVLGPVERSDNKNGSMATPRDGAKGWVS